MAFAGIAKACEQNLQKTLRFGGRLEFPSNMELRAMLVSLQQGWGCREEWETQLCPEPLARPMCTAWCVKIVPVHHHT